MANCNGVPSLKKLANTVLGIEIQQGEHDSISQKCEQINELLLFRQDEGEISSERMNAYKVLCSSGARVDSTAPSVRNSTQSIKSDHHFVCDVG
ncbi:hypothetical protein NECAME_06583 [Necator americanus]|uniref:Uncharacterized protein n=1 Tax=Necator americanus TaxID=51031 RepID=W2TVE2_NECAM|nr:hypothetical protein NECAME_06583 [Necator americanus]ETN85036.1 hypothetical protein NECAME_06583 [Necator americanus]